MKGGSAVMTEVAEPYAQALMALAQSHDLVDKFGEDAGALLQLLQDSEEFEQFLANPIVKTEDKKVVLQRVVGDQVHPYLKSFLSLLVDRRRISFLKSVLKQYQALLRELRQTVLAEVVSAVELSEEQKQSVRDRVVSMTGAQQVELDSIIDPDLIGGVIIKVGSQIVDASLKGQLRRISLRLNTAN